MKRNFDFIKYAVLTALVVFFAAGCSDFKEGRDDDKTSYTLLFDSQGGSNVSPITLAAGTSVTLPTPTRSGYTFNGWFSATSGGAYYGGAGDSYTLAGNLTMYGQWTQVGGTAGKDGDVATINGIECVLVKAGTFTMGSPTSEDGRDNNETQHQVTLTQDYWLSKYEITQAQYQAVMGNNPSSFSGSNNPVERVDWDEANDFCEAVGGRLPTEAEWEFAARGGNKSQGFIYSGSNDLDEVGWYDGNSSSKTQPVGQKQPNELGIYDMSGNVREWCSDWYGLYPTNAVTNPTGISWSSDRVIRGGCWNDDITRYCRVAGRDSNPPSYDNFFLGFRVAFSRN